MALITVPDGFPGIVGPMKAYPRGAQHLNGLADEILRGASSLTPAEREMIGPPDLPTERGAKRNGIKEVGQTGAR